MLLNTICKDADSQQLTLETHLNKPDAIWTITLRLNKPLFWHCSEKWGERKTEGRKDRGQT